ncbi:BQ5605_C028g10529 [Microbotryum silenes-dioicae]|uniref:BQ5605_C028g10529 protein n=1 Tax=Microbotryum silenes-dioicae TaxID=796604 RepID=A0A2X0MM29_9BASI|nr:BQ5605_C028g10529 [Microbotryum silenes-dioicae]
MSHYIESTSYNHDGVVDRSPRPRVAPGPAVAAFSVESSTTGAPYLSPSQPTPTQHHSPVRHSARGMSSHHHAHHAQHASHLQSPLSSPHLGFAGSPRFSHTPGAPQAPGPGGAPATGYAGPGVLNYHNLEMASYPSNGAGPSTPHHHDMHSSPMMGGSRVHSPAPALPSHSHAGSYYSASTQHTSVLGGPSAASSINDGPNPASNNHNSNSGSAGGHHSVHASPYHTPILRHSESREPSSPRVMTTSTYSPTIRVLQWTPQHGDEGTQVTIVLDSYAINGAPATQYSIAAFGPGSSTSGHKTAVTRRFVVAFGVAAAPTRFARAQNIDGNGVAQSMSAGPNEMDAFVVLSTFVPARQSMGPLNERVLVSVRVLDEGSAVLEETVVGEWDAAPPLPPSPVRRALPTFKRSGDELEIARDAPGLRSPLVTHSTPRRNREYLSPPQTNGQFSSPVLGGGGGGAHHPGRSPRLDDSETVASASLRHPPLQDDQDPGEIEAPPSQPDLLRTSQIPPSLVDDTGSSLVTFSNKATLKLQGDLNQMAMGWSNEEWTNRRRLIQFWRSQEGNQINATFRPILQNDFVPNSIVISCIFRDDWNECFVTSVDTIYLLEALVGVRFTVEEKNRIRRNLEGFKPMTVSKSKAESEPFFKLIMGFPNPKPRNIEKDVKVFPWKVLAGALKKIISKYLCPRLLRGETFELTPMSHPITLSYPQSATYTSSASNELINAGTIPLTISNEAFSQPQTPHMSPAMNSSAHFASPHVGRSGSAVPSPHLGVSDRYGDGTGGAGVSLSNSHFASSTSGGSARLESTHVPSSPHQHRAPPSSYLSSSVPASRSNPTNVPTSLNSIFRPSHSRPGSFDFNSILESSNFAPSGSSSAYDRRPSYSTNMAHPHLFPSAEDYGISSSFMNGGGTALSAPAMSHSRSFSEGPRRDSLTGQQSLGTYFAAPSAANNNTYSANSYAPPEVVYNQDHTSTSTSPDTNNGVEEKIENASAVGTSTSTTTTTAGAAPADTN